LTGKKTLSKTIIDLGCGTGLLTCELAKQGYQMIGIEPSRAMLDVARSKPYAEEIKWLEGSYEKFGGLHVDMVLMTSHVAQFFLDDEKWRSMLKACHDVLKIGGYIVFDIRRFSDPPFDGWPTEDNRKKFENTTAGPIEFWFKLLDVRNEHVRYELHYFFLNSGEELVSVNELVFRSKEEIIRALSDNGFTVKTIYGD
jgi:SAM-dependent methyltransferase